MSRAIIKPRMMAGADSLVWNEIFQFTSNSGRVESLIWMQIAVCEKCVHVLGLRIQGDRPTKQYAGFLRSDVSTISASRTVRGHWFSLSHKPDEGEWHVHIKVESPEGVSISPQDKLDIRALMQDAFTKYPFTEYAANTPSTAAIPDAQAPHSRP